MSSTFNQIYENSIKNPEKFWQEASEDIFWFKKPTKILNKSNPPFYKWFEDGVTNTCYNAVDLHIDNGRGDKTAIIYDSPITGTKYKLSYTELRARLPQEISNDIVMLLANSKQALLDFANIQTTEDIASFNQQYDVNLTLPQGA